MLQDKLHFFVARFSVPSGIWKIFACGIRNPEKNLESGILGFGILNLSKKIRNPTNEIRTNPESTTWKPESKTVLDSLTRGETSRKGLI